MEKKKDGVQSKTGDLNWFVSFSSQVVLKIRALGTAFFATKMNYGFPGFPPKFGHGSNRDSPNMIVFLIQKYTKGAPQFCAARLAITVEEPPLAETSALEEALWEMLTAGGTRTSWATMSCTYGKSRGRRRSQFASRR